MLTILSRVWAVFLLPLIFCHCNSELKDKGSQFSAGKSNNARQLDGYGKSAGKRIGSSGNLDSGSQGSQNSAADSSEETRGEPLLDDARQEQIHHSDPSSAGVQEPSLSTQSSDSSGLGTTGSSTQADPEIPNDQLRGNDNQLSSAVDQGIPSPQSPALAAICTITGTEIDQDDDDQDDNEAVLVVVGLFEEGIQNFDPVIHDVTISFGGQDTLIPAAFFEQDDEEISYEGDDDTEAELDRETNEFSVEVELIAITLPLADTEFKLSVGDKTCAASLAFDIEGKPITSGVGPI